MSVTKSIVGLAIGRLLYLGKLSSLDEPVCEFFPTWRSGPKREILVRHLLSQTSGLAADRTTESIYASKDFVQFALEADVESPAGTRFFYNNRATNLLAGIVERAAECKLDRFMADEFFAPLGIHQWSWTHDQSGTPHAMSGLSLRASDLAKFGQIMINRGTWEGTRLVSEDWVSESSVASQPYYPHYGLLWWLVPESVEFTIDDSILHAWRTANPPVDERFIERVLPLKDRRFTREGFRNAVTKALGIEPTDSGVMEWNRNTRQRGLPEVRTLPSRIIGVYGEGYLGQYLVVLPGSQTVAVLQRTGREPFDKPTEFLDFVRRFEQP
jgi:CubicO group peptidase (beta-lactamase class C family)